MHWKVAIQESFLLPILLTKIESMERKKGFRDQA